MEKDLQVLDETKRVVENDIQVEKQKPVGSMGCRRRIWDSDQQKIFAEYYRCGGDQLSDKTKILTAMGMRPPGSTASIHLAIQGVRSYEKLKDKLQKTIIDL